MVSTFTQHLHGVNGECSESEEEKAPVTLTCVSEQNSLDTRYHLTPLLIIAVVGKTN